MSRIREIAACWREIVREASWYRRVLLLAMAAMIVGFGVATPIVASREGIEYGGAFLTAEKGETQRYAGRLDGREAVFTLLPERTVEYQWGEYAYGPYQVRDLPEASPRGLDIPGIAIWSGEKLLFRGGYEPTFYSCLVQEDGEPLWEMETWATTSNGTMFDENGRELSQREIHAPSLAFVARLAMGDVEHTHRGSVGIYLAVTVLAVLNILQILFPGFFFQLSLLGHVSNIGDAEPSEFYIFMERVEWLILTGACLYLYWLALTEIF